MYLLSPYKGVNECTTAGMAIKFSWHHTLGYEPETAETANIYVYHSWIYEDAGWWFL